MVNPYLFIVGCPRSGTTLLQRVVDAHPKVAILPEANWIYHVLMDPSVVIENGAVAPGLVPTLLEHPKFRPLGITHEHLTRLIGEHSRISYSSFVSRIFDLYGEMQGKELVGNKTPGLARRLDVIHAMWPEARIVHLIRDGRDVYLSMKNRLLHTPLGGWSDDPVSSAALWWELNVQKGRNARRSFAPELYYEVRFESLVNNPGEVCTELCTFLGVPYSEAMVRLYEKRKRKRASQPITPALRDWRSQMQSKDIEIFEAAAGKTLEDLGYTRAFPHPAAELVERSTRSRNLLLKEAAHSAALWVGRLDKANGASLPTTGA
jgi:hypothetical protein